MYYAKFSNNQLIDTIKDASFTLYNVYITYSNNVIVLNYKGARSGYNDTYVILKEGIIKDDYIYLPLNEDNKTYYITISNSPNYDNYKPNFQTINIYDENFVLVGNRYFIYFNNCIVVLKNPNTIISNQILFNSASANGSGYKIISSTKESIQINLSEILKSIVAKGKYTTFNVNNIAYTRIMGSYMFLWGTNMYDPSNNYGQFYQIISSKENTFDSVFSGFGYYGYSLPTYSPYSARNIFKLGDTKTFSTSVSGINVIVVNDIEDMYIMYDGWYIPKPTNTEFFSSDESILIFYSKSGINISYTDTLSANFSYYTYQARTSSNANITYYQDTYTPTNKLQTLTFSDLEVLHNEESGTFALTFKINNPNEVSVSTNIHISGREDVTDITAPSGTSEWSYIIEENKDGTIQATDISALGYENADDSATYKYLAWIEPGYLRELAVSSVFLSTINDKDYTLNVFVTNNNDITIPAVLHYGKNSELTKSITLKSGFNSVYVTNVENTNGSIWIHPESISGYYPLPDTDAVSYTKLPIPPIPSSTGITLYKNNNNNKVVNKGYKLETYKILNGTFRDEVNILNPTFQIENDEVPDCNYCYIADFRRYYYIDTITCIRTGLYELQCSVDVLYTYKDKILSSEQYVSRQENDYNELLVDNMVTFDSTYDYVISYQNIDELDYASVNSNDTSITNIILCTFGS